MKGRGSKERRGRVGRARVKMEGGGGEETERGGVYSDQYRIKRFKKCNIVVSKSTNLERKNFVRTMARKTSVPPGRINQQ